MIVHCKECRKKISDSANSCPSCGASQNLSNSNNIILIIPVVIAILIIIGFISDISDGSIGNGDKMGFIKPPEEQIITTEEPIILTLDEKTKIAEAKVFCNEVDADFGFANLEVWQDCVNQELDWNTRERYQQLRKQEQLQTQVDIDSEFSNNLFE